MEQTSKQAYTWMNTHEPTSTFHGYHVNHWIGQAPSEFQLGSFRWTHRANESEDMKEP